MKISFKGRWKTEDLKTEDLKTEDEEAR